MADKLEAVPGARTFRDGSAYDAFMGRYSIPLSTLFADAAGIKTGSPHHLRLLDVGCGPGALTSELVSRLGSGPGVTPVSACDPSPPFVDDCAHRHPGVAVSLARAEALPYPDAAFDGALAQLVFHFVSEPAKAAAEMRRVTRRGGVVAACVWDFDGGMEMLRAFWDAALQVRPDAPDEARVMRFGRKGELTALFQEAGLVDANESEIKVSASYGDFEELWASLLHGIGPAGSFAASLQPEEQERLRSELFKRLGEPKGSFSLDAVARCAVAHVPEKEERPRAPEPEATGRVSLEAQNASVDDPWV